MFLSHGLSLRQLRTHKQVHPTHLALSGTGTPACAPTTTNPQQATDDLGPISPPHQRNPTHDSNRISESSISTYCVEYTAQ